MFYRNYKINIVKIKVPHNLYNLERDIMKRNLMLLMLIQLACASTITATSGSPIANAQQAKQVYIKFLRLITPAPWQQPANQQQIIYLLSKLKQQPFDPAIQQNATDMLRGYTSGTPLSGANSPDQESPHKKHKSI